MSLEKFSKLYKDNGFDVELVDDKLTLKIDNLIVQCTIEEEWIKSIDSYFNLITHDPQPASRADMASEGLPRLHAP
ncbi:hypothetical protein, partial [Aeromonas sp. QDB14]|uniref:hypothetical protein n=1 Tax=Aeromonas sp. QDB14 TaxID=2989836 RepID=UPI0022E8DBB1